MALNILIVDDEAEMQEILSRFLEPIASRVDAVDNLSTALELTRADQYHIIILDLRLKFTGKEEALMAVRELKAKGAAVIVISGLFDPHLKEDCLAAGADEFLSKNAGFSSQALLIAAHVVALRLPKDLMDHDFLDRIKVLERMVGINRETEPKPTTA